MNKLFVELLDGEDVAHVFEFRIIEEILCACKPYINQSDCYGEVIRRLEINKKEVMSAGLNIFIQPMMMVYVPTKQTKDKGWLVYPKDFESFMSYVYSLDQLRKDGLGEASRWMGYIEEPKTFIEIKPVTGMPEVLWPFLQDKDVDDLDLDKYLKRGGSPQYPVNIDLVYRYLLYSECKLVVTDARGEIFNRGEGDVTNIFDDGLTYHLYWTQQSN